MNPLFIEKTKTTPNVEFNKEKDIFSITGHSLPEDALKFYQPILNWFKTYIESPSQSTLLKFELEYFNTATSKVIFELISMLNVPYSQGFEVKVNWHYLEDDEDLLEMGQDYATLVKIPFEFTSYVG